MRFQHFPVEEIYIDFDGCRCRCETVDEQVKTVHIDLMGIIENGTPKCEYCGNDLEFYGVYRKTK